jgi:hypothetical protein
MLGRLSQVQLEARLMVFACGASNMYQQLIEELRFFLKFSLKRR